MKKTFVRSALAAALLAWAAFPAPAYVEAIMPLQQVLTESTVIVEGTVESHDPQKKIAVIKCGKALKGQNPYEKIRITYAGGRSEERRVGKECRSRGAQ